MNDVLQEIFDYYQDNLDMNVSENLVAMLKEIQEAQGYIPEEVQMALTERFSIKPAYLSAVIKRYPSLKAQPSRYDIRICMDARCQKNDSSMILAEFERQLGISKGQSTPDGLFSLGTCPCLHLCPKGPNVMINGKIFEHVGKAQVGEIIKEYRGE